LFNIANSEPFTPAQVLWIHFIVNAPFGFALGFDKETPGLMARRPRPRGESVLTTPVIVTVGVTGLAITISLPSLIQYGTSHFHSVQIGNTIAFTAFALALIVAAVECRSQTATVLTVDTFNSKQMNYAMIGEFVLAVLVTQMDVFHRLLGTVDINLRQFGWALIPALALLVLWGLGKLIARRRAGPRSGPGGCPGGRTANPPATGPAAGVRRWIPGIEAVSTYHARCLTRDLLAGLVLTPPLVPQGMAYAELAGLPP